VALGDMIRERRTACGYSTHEALADRLRLHGVEVSRQTVSNWERGAATPRAESLRILLDMLGVYGEERDRAYRLAAGEAE